MNRMPTRAVAVVALVAASVLLGACFLNSGEIRSAGWPHDLADLEGTWVLDEVRGTFDVAPPETISFEAGTGPEVVQVSDGRRTAEFVVQGAGRLVFAVGQHFEPLLPAGATEAYTMTHSCPALPAWDQLIFFPDGAPNGRDPSRRIMVYERD
jgi:hypothetical protein